MITIIALTKSEGEDQKDTVTKLEQQCKKKGIPFYGVRLGEAFVSIQIYPTIKSLSIILMEKIIR